MIEAEGLSKYYGRKLALDKLSFRIGKGEIVGFLGSNGAGKSTTMNILTGFLSLSEGEVRINGYDIFSEARRARASVGYLPEQPPLYPEFSVNEYLGYVCGLKKLERKTWGVELERVLRLCALTEVSRRKIAFLSKGFRQRVGLAQALLGSPPLLILDEATSGLDPQQILEFRKLIQQLGQEHTILLSSHILSEIEAVCERVLILHQGRLVGDGSAAMLGRGMGTSSQVLRMELLGPEAGRELLGEILQEQGIREFSLAVRSLWGPETSHLVVGGVEEAKGRESLYQLEFQMSLSTEASGKTVEQLSLEKRGSYGRSLTRGGFTIVGLSIGEQRSLEDIFLDLTVASSVAVSGSLGSEHEELKGC